MDDNKANNRQLTIGLIVDERDKGFSVQIISEFVSITNKMNINVVCFPVEFSKCLPLIEQKPLYSKIIDTGSLDCLIVLPVLPDQQPAVCEILGQWLNKIPVISITPVINELVYLNILNPRSGQMDDLPGKSLTKLTTLTIQSSYEPIASAAVCLASHLLYSQFIDCYNPGNVFTQIDNEIKQESNEYTIADVKEEKMSNNKKNIFVIEDNVRMMIFLQSSLSEQYNVYIAFSGKEAFKKLKFIPLPDLILSEIIIDETDNKDLMEKIRVTPDYSGIPYILLSASTSLSDKINALRNGAIDYLVKPFSIEELTARIGSIISYSKNLINRNVIAVKEKIMNVLDNIGETCKYPDQYLYFDKICTKYNITHREKDVLYLLLQGLLNKEIGFKLNIRRRTVEFHIQNIYKKFDVENRIELINIIKEINF